MSSSPYPGLLKWSARETGRVSRNGSKVFTCAFPEHEPGFPDVEGRAATT